jgi:hypothetical protein
MTAEDIRRQKADLLLEYQEALDRSTALRTKLRANSQFLAGISEWINHVIRGDVESCTRSATVYSKTMGNHINPEEDKRFQESMNFPGLMALLDEYSGSLRRVEELRKMKVDMGLGS